MNQQFGAVSPFNYDPLMLQQIAPLQTNQNFENHAMSSNLTPSNNMFNNLSALNSGPSIGNTMSNNVSSQLNNNITNQYSPSMPPTNNITSPQNNINLNNLNMLGNSIL